MRVLTVRQPWAGAIIHQGKNVENRTRNIAGDYRGPVAIHAALRHDYSAVDDLIARTGHLSPHNTYGYGAIIGVVDLVAVHAVDEVGCMAAIDLCSRWADTALGMHHLRFENPRALDQPVSYKGALGLRKTQFEVVGDWLAERADSCTCGSPLGIYPHEQYCGLEPVAQLKAGLS